MSNKECWSANGEDFNYDSLGDLFDNEDADYQVGDVVYKATAKTPSFKSMVDIDSVIENIGERAWDYCGEYAENYPEVSQEHKAKLQKFLEEWLSECPHPNFYMVVNDEPYTLTEEDFN